LRLLEPNVAPLAAFEDMDGDDVPKQRIGKGGLLAVISDGMTDARSPTGEEFGLDRLVRILNDHAQSAPQTQAAALREGVRGWQGNDSPVDDQSIVLAQRTE
jgi:serine phosphatase RsbU (regulator of sigma subunit)